MSKAWFHDSNCFLARYPVDPARREEFLSALNDMFAMAQPWYEEHAHFAFHGWARDPNTWVVIAAWKNEEILERLRKDPDWQKHSVRMLDCCTGPMIIEQFSRHEGRPQRVRPLSRRKVRSPSWDQVTWRHVHLKLCPASLRKGTSYGF